MIHVKKIKNIKNTVKKLAIGLKIYSRILVLGDECPNNRSGCKRQ